MYVCMYVCVFSRMMFQCWLLLLVVVLLSSKAYSINSSDTSEPSQPRPPIASNLKSVIIVSRMLVLLLYWDFSPSWTKGLLYLIVFGQFKIYDPTQLVYLKLSLLLLNQIEA